MYKKVLVPIMGNFSEDLAEHAIDLIDGRDVDLFVVYVIDGSVPFLTPKNIKKAMAIELKKRGKCFLEEFENILNLSENKNISLEKILTEGKPAEEIVRIAKEKCIDVIVMGTGKSIVDKHLLGSVSDEVVHFAPCTILLVRTIENKACENPNS
ncbi:MAG: universal stress protein [Methanobrevibacter sp.]|nr:universal stress protein [Methanobrevibacter sp.]